MQATHKPPIEIIDPSFRWEIDPQVVVVPSTKRKKEEEPPQPKPTRKAKPKKVKPRTKTQQVFLLPPTAGAPPQQRLPVDQWIIQCTTNTIDGKVVETALGKRPIPLSVTLDLVAIDAPTSVGACNAVAAFLFDTQIPLVLCMRDVHMRDHTLAQLNLSAAQRSGGIHCVWSTTGAHATNVATYTAMAKRHGFGAIYFMEPGDYRAFRRSYLYAASSRQNKKGKV